MTAVLGVYVGHDPGACLLVDGAVVAWIEEERLTRFKHGIPKDVRDLWPRFGGRFGYLPWASITYCLRAGGLGLDDLDLLVLPEAAAETPMGDLFPLKDPSRLWIARDPAGGVHHLSHAMTAFLGSPWERAAVLVVDGDGSVRDGTYEAESGYVFEDRGGAHREVFKNRYPQAAQLKSGLGWAYDHVSMILGFVDTRIGYLTQPGKTMGLAPYGAPTPELEAPWIRRDGFQLDFSALHTWLVEAGQVERLRFDTRERALIQAEGAISTEARNLAWKIQHELEEAWVGLAQALHEATGETRLCVSGGVALNSVANGLLRERTGFEDVWVQPAAHDGGQALGLALLGHLHLAEDGAEVAPIAPLRSAYGGRRYAAEEVAELLRRGGLEVKPLEEEALVEDAAARLAQGEVVGWFQGGSECGPRALGHRSILADPRGAETKDRLNARVKFRESFRPFAPSVLAERAAEVFELEGESPFMLMVRPVREAWREKVPAITHVDGTARIQTVQAEVAPRYHALIQAFAARTEVPLLLNTSFNLRGMPIVETPEDALRCFLYTDMDALYLGEHRVLPPSARQVRPCAAPGWRLVVENRVGWGGQEAQVRYETEREEERRTVEVRPVPELVLFCQVLNGQRSLYEAVGIATETPRPQPDVLAAFWAFVRLMLREGAFCLRVGELEL